MKSLQDFITKPITSTHLPISLFSSSKPHQDPFSTTKTQSFSKISTAHLPNPTKYHGQAQKISSFLKNFAFLTPLSLPLPSSAAETELVSDKINIESILISIDDFFNRYPFFVASCTFVWLVVIPLTEQYLKKYKFISAIDAFRKLRDLPNSELLDMRKKKSLNFLNSPNLRVLNKSVVHVEFVEGEEEAFVAEVLKRFGDAGNTVVCIMDNFDGNSLKVAELLFKNGFKEAYAIKGGLRGKDGWQEIQETLLPPSVHVYPDKRKGKSSGQSEKNRERIKEKNGSNGSISPSPVIKQEHSHDAQNGHPKPMENSPEAEQVDGRPLSPYTKNPDLKPPSSPAE